MVKKSFLNMLFRARWTYLVIGIVFIFVGSSQGEFNFSNSFFGAGFVVLILGILLVILNRVLNKKW